MASRQLAYGAALWLTPLCPAGHLPHKGGDHKQRAHGPKTIPRGIQRLPMEWRVKAHPISPFVGEMPGRAEGGIAR
ncbi:hypothetical protein D3C73_529010 [compost metagenome]|jgi:hypothetical protein